MSRSPTNNRQASPSPTHIAGYTMDACIGKGNYSAVYKAHKNRGNYKLAAIKCITISTLSKQSKDNLMNEINILKQIKSQHVVAMKQFTWDQRYIYLILEYCPGGNLAEFIKLKGSLSEFLTQHFVQQLTLGLECLHSKNIVHCDLKPENILLSVPPLGSCRNVKLKIADFGFSRRLQANQKYINGIKGSPQYMAPEILGLKPYSSQADMFSLGVIIFECLFGHAPYKTNDLNVLYNHIMSSDPIKLPTTPFVSEDCASLLLGLLVKDQEKRLTFDELLKHAFVDMQHFPSIENYYKGANIVKQAIILDEAHNFEDARTYYIEGLHFLMPAYYWLDTFNDNQRKILSKRIQEYCDRAEQIPVVN